MGSQGGLEALQDLGGASVVVNEGITEGRQLADLLYLMAQSQGEGGGGGGGGRGTGSIRVPHHTQCQE